MIEFFNAKGLREPEMLKNGERYEAYTDFETEASIQRLVLLLLENSRPIVLKMRANGIKDTCTIIKRFKNCNWDTLDDIPDITDDNQLNFEYVSCGYKGANQRCPHALKGDSKPYCIVKNLFDKPITLKK